MAKTIEETTGALRAFTSNLFSKIKELTGSEPTHYPSNGWYKFTDETIFLFARIHGDSTKAVNCFPNSVELQAQWDDSWEDQAGVRMSSNALWGSPAAEACFAAQPDVLNNAIMFVETALDLHRRKRQKGITP